ncbi:hypothetical protein ACJX0J_010677, partial [Zea mays]
SKKTFKKEKRKALEKKIQIQGKCIPLHASGFIREILESWMIGTEFSFLNQRHTHYYGPFFPQNNLSLSPNLRGRWQIIKIQVARACAGIVWHFGTTIIIDFFLLWGHPEQILGQT